MPLGARWGFRARGSIAPFRYEEQTGCSLPDLPAEAFDGRPRLGLDAASPFDLSTQVRADFGFLVGAHGSLIGRTQRFQCLIGHRDANVDRAATDHMGKLVAAIGRRTPLAVCLT